MTGWTPAPGDLAVSTMLLRDGRIAVGDVIRFDTVLPSTYAHGKGGSVTVLRNGETLFWRPDWCTPLPAQDPA